MTQQGSVTGTTVGDGVLDVPYAKQPKSAMWDVEDAVPYGCNISIVTK